MPVGDAAATHRPRSPLRGRLRVGTATGRFTGGSGSSADRPVGTAAPGAARRRSSGPTTAPTPTNAPTRLGATATASTPRGTRRCVARVTTAHTGAAGPVACWTSSVPLASTWRAPAPAGSAHCSTQARRPSSARSARTASPSAPTGGNANDIREQGQRLEHLSAQDGAQRTGTTQSITTPSTAFQTQRHRAERSIPEDHRPSHTTADKIKSHVRRTTTHASTRAKRTIASRSDGGVREP